MRVLGVDTSLRSTGAVVVESKGNSLVALEQAVFKTSSSSPLSECLRNISAGIEDMVARLQPDAAAMEGIFYCKNVKTAVTLGEARGAVILCCSRAGLPVYEYAPRRVKQAVAGRGGADKSQVRKMVMTLCALDDEPMEDAGDALAIAICHLHNVSGHSLLAPTEI